MVALGGPSSHKNTPASPAPYTTPTAPTDAAKKAWAAAQAQAATNASPPASVKPGQTLTGIAGAHGDSLWSVQNANPQIPYDPFPYKNLIYPGETVDLPHHTPREVVPPLDDSKIRPIIYALGNAQAYDKAHDIPILDKVPYGLGALTNPVLAQSDNNWAAVRQLTYNALISGNHGLFPNQAAAKEIDELDALEPHNTQFESETNAALKEADQQWQQNGIIAYSNYVQTVQQVNQYLANPSLPHNLGIVSGLHSEVAQAQSTFYTTVENALNNAAKGAGSNPVARYNAVNARVASIESLGPSGSQASAFKAAVQAAQYDYQVLQPATTIAAAYANGGAAAGAKALATATHDAGNAHIAFEIIKASQPTIDSIGKDLGTLAGSVQSPEPPSSSTATQFDQIYTDLSQSVQAATTLNIPLQNGVIDISDLQPGAKLPLSLSSDGQQAANLIGAAIAAGAPKNMQGYQSILYDRAAASAIGQGDFAGLTFAAAAAAKRSGNAELASILVEGAAAGIATLKGKVDQDVSHYTTDYADLSSLQSTWEPFMTGDQLKAADAGYLKDHPNVATTGATDLATIAQDGDAILEAEAAWQTYGLDKGPGGTPPALAGISTLSGLTGAEQNLVGSDKSAAFAIAQSPLLAKAYLSALTPQNYAQGGESAWQHIIDWPGFTAVRGARSALSALFKALGKKGTPLFGSSAKYPVTGARLGYTLGIIGLALTLENLWSKKGSLASDNQERLYTAYSVLGLIKYSLETTSGIPKTAIVKYTEWLKTDPGFQDFLKKQPAYTTAFDAAVAKGASVTEAAQAGEKAVEKGALNDRIDANFGNTTLSLADLSSKGWYKTLGGVYYALGAASAGWEAYDLSKEPDADWVPITLNSLEAAANVGNALKPVLGAFGAEALGETVAGVSSIIGLGVAIGLAGWQLYQDGKHAAAYDQDAANFLKNAHIGPNGLDPGLIRLLTQPLGSPEQLSSVLQAYANQYHLHPQSLLLALNKEYEDPYTKSGVSTFLYEASRTQPSNGKYAPRNGYDTPILTPQQAQRYQLVSSNSLRQLYYWSAYLFGTNGLGEKPPNNG